MVRARQRCLGPRPLLRLPFGGCDQVSTPVIRIGIRASLSASGRRVIPAPAGVPSHPAGLPRAQARMCLGAGWTLWLLDTWAGLLRPLPLGLPLLLGPALLLARFHILQDCESVLSSGPEPGLLAALACYRSRPALAACCLPVSWRLAWLATPPELAACRWYSWPPRARGYLLLDTALRVDHCSTMLGQLFLCPQLCILTGGSIPAQLSTHIKAQGFDVRPRQHTSIVTVARRDHSSIYSLCALHSQLLTLST